MSSDTFTKTNTMNTRHKNRRVGGKIGSYTVSRKVEYLPSKRNPLRDVEVPGRRVGRTKNTAHDSHAISGLNRQNTGLFNDDQTLSMDIDAMDFNTTEEGARLNLLGMPMDQSRTKASHVGITSPYILISLQTQSDYLQDWVTRRDDHLQALFEEEAPFTEDNGTNMCGLCRSERGLWRCDECNIGSIICSACCTKAHKRSCFHRVKKWNGHFFQPTPLWTLGIRVHLGHGGEPCPARMSDVEDVEEIVPVLDAVEEEQLESENDDEQVEEFVLVTIATTGGFPRAPTKTLSGIPIVTIVHKNGVHELPCVPCLCHHAAPDDILFMRQQLFPATAHDIRTAFTFDGLRTFHMLTLEGKMTAYTYYRVLRRLTCPSQPHTVPNRERELRRVMRQWRNLKLYQEAGFGHRAEKPGKGDLVLYCAACPQPGINLPDNWQEDPEWLVIHLRCLGYIQIISNSPVITRVLAVDGNSKADHIKSRSNAEDVGLTEGQGFMTEQSAYKSFITLATELAPRFKQVSASSSALFILYRGK